MRVGELAGQAGVSAPTVRFYEREGMLTPPRRSEAGYRLYAPEALAELRFITRAKTLGLSLDQIRVLRSQPDAEAERRQLRHLVVHQLIRTRRQLDELRAMEDALARLFGTLAGPRPGRDHGRGDAEPFGAGEGGPGDAEQPAVGADELLAAAALADETARIKASTCRCTCALDPGCTCGCPCCAPAGTAAPGTTGAARSAETTGREEER